MAYRHLGDGPPVVLLHGFPTNSALWEREAMLLASRCRVVAPDLLGYGDSDKPAGADLSAPAQAGYVAELLGALGVVDYAVVGHDVGGAVAQLLSLGAGVRALVLLDSACFDAWPIEGVRMLQAATPDQETPEFVEDVVRLAIHLGMARANGSNDRLVEAFVRPWRQDPGAFFRAARSLDGVGPAGREGDLAALTVPVLIVWGEEDPYFPPDLGERLGELILGSTVALLPGCSHFVTLDAPHTVGPLVFEFLRRRYLGDIHSHAPRPGGPVPVFLERPPQDVLEALDGHREEE